MIKKILIVEDEKSLFNVTAKSLRDSGYEVIMAEQGGGGLAVAREESPDLILTDLLMPYMDGEEMVRKIRQEEWGKNIPIIVLTNLDQESELGTKVLAQKIDAYLIKSNTTISNLLEKIKSVR